MSLKKPTTGTLNQYSNMNKTGRKNPHIRLEIAITVFVRGRRDETLIRFLNWKPGFLFGNITILLFIALRPSKISYHLNAYSPDFFASASLLQCLQLLVFRCNRLQLTGQ